MAPATEGGANGNGPQWRIPGHTARVAAGDEPASAGADADVTAGRPPTLEVLVTRGGRLPLPAALLVLDDVLSTLTRLHGVGVIHGHVRPAAIAIDQEGRCRLDDRAASPAAARSGGLRYTAPEVLLHGDRRSTASDVYAAAAVFYEALTGQPPLLGAESLDEAKVPILARSLLEEGLAQHPGRRPASAARLQDDLAVAGDAFLGESWRAGGRAWLSAATRAVQSDRDLIGSPWGRRVQVEPAADAGTSAAVAGPAADETRAVLFGRTVKRRHLLVAGALLATAGLLAVIGVVVGGSSPHTTPPAAYRPATGGVPTLSATPSAPIFATVPPTPTPAPTPTPSPTPSPTATAAATVAPAQNSSLPVAPGPARTPPPPTPTPCLLGLIC
jgi:serine/threonine-protein kinase